MAVNKTQITTLVPATGSEPAEQVWTKTISVKGLSAGAVEAPSDGLRRLLKSPRNHIGCSAKFPEDQAITVLFVSSPIAAGDRSLIAEGITGTSYVTVRHAPSDHGFADDRSRILRSKDGKLHIRVLPKPPKGPNDRPETPAPGNCANCLAYAHYHLDPTQYELHQYVLIQTPSVLPHFFASIADGWEMTPKDVVKGFRMVDNKFAVPQHGKEIEVNPASVIPSLRVVYQEPPLSGDDDSDIDSDPPPCIKVSGTMDENGNFVVDTVMIIRYGDENGGGGNGGG